MICETCKDERSHKSAAVRTRIFTALLLLVGVSEPIGSALRLSSLREFGRLTSASNSPLVFNQVEGVEFWANRFRFEFHDAAGRIVDLPVTNDVLASILGPHTRTAAYVVPIGLGSIAGQGLYIPPLRYGFCFNGPLARDLRYHEVMKSVTIRIESGSPMDQRRWALHIPCVR